MGTVSGTYKKYENFLSMYEWGGILNIKRKDILTTPTVKALLPIYNTPSRDRDGYVIC